MKFIHAREHLNEGDVVVVDCDTQCNVMVTTDTEFARFKRSNKCTYYGGFYEYFPVRIEVPHSGYWNTTIDVGAGYNANIRYSISYEMFN